MKSLEMILGGEIMTVTIYTKPACMQCNATHRAFDKAGIDYTTVDITEDPVVIAGDEHGSGYRPDRIRRLTAA